MRLRTSACRLAVLALSMCAFTSVASAAPTVTFKAKAVPITGFPHTGNILGAGAAIEAEFTISGTEYGGFPPPLAGVSFSLPMGLKLHTAGFSSCPDNTLVEAHEPEACPKNSRAGAAGHASGFVDFGTERVPEALSIEPFNAPGGGVNLFVAAHTPASIEAVAIGHYLNLESTGSSGPELSVEMPLIQTVPGGADVSLKTIELTLGSALKKGQRTTYSETMPRSCLAHGYRIKAELTFAGVGGLTQTTADSSYNMPCPRRGLAEGEAPLPTPEAPVPGTGGVVTAPSNKACLSRRDFTIHVVQIKGVTYREVSVYVNGHRVRVERGGRIHAPVDLRGLPKGRYTVRITVTTSSGHKITGTRTYHTCAPKPLHPRRNPRL